jgi:hypothetical protein
MMVVMTVIAVSLHLFKTLFEKPMACQLSDSQQCLANPRTLGESASASPAPVPAVTASHAAGIHPMDRGRSFGVFT